ncbi:MAG TPA: phage holin family protein [Actinomycetota bacterium]
MPEQSDDLRDLLRQLSRDGRVLLQQEAELAKAELRDKSKTVVRSAALFGGAALLGLIAAGALTASAVLAIALILPPWAAALIVATASALAAMLLALRGRQRLQTAMPLLPERAIASVQEDVEWVKHQTRSTRTSRQYARG